MHIHSDTRRQLDRPIGRRSFLGVMTAAAGALALSACGGAGAASSSGSNALSTVALQLNYLKNVQFAGSLVALDGGIYKANGLDMTLTAGGPNLAVEPVVQSGKALVGITHTATAVNAINNGAGLTIIGAGYQKNPFCIVSQASKPIASPKDLPGKKIGVSATNLPIWNAFLKANNIAASSVTVVTIDFGPTPLATGEVDGFVAFYTNEPIILELKGIKTQTMLLNDFGYPLLEDVYITKTSNLKDPQLKKQVVEVMKSEAQGWQKAVKDPSVPAKLAVDVYGKDLKLNLDQQTKQATAQNALVVSDVTNAHGLFWMSDADIAATVKSLALGGSTATTSMFTNDILTAVYNGKATA